MTVRHAVVQVALGRRLLLRDLYTQPVLIKSIAEECDLLFLRVCTANSHPDEIILEADELCATLTLAPVVQRPLVSPDDSELPVKSEHIRPTYALDPYFSKRDATIEV